LLVGRTRQGAPPVSVIEPVRRLLRLEFGPSRSKRFADALAAARGGPSECSEVEPGRYQVSFLLERDAETYRGLGRLLERVRHWRATDVYEQEEPVSVYHAKDIRVSGCPKIAHQPPYYEGGPCVNGGLLCRGVRVGVPVGFVERCSSLYRLLVGGSGWMGASLRWRISL
jgi:hypothetical protein